VQNLEIFPLLGWPDGGSWGRACLPWSGWNFPLYPGGPTYTRDNSSWL